MNASSNAAACACGILAGVAGGAAQSAPRLQSDLVYTPIKACRAFDTRATAPIAGGQVRSFHIAGSADFPAQGGAAQGCGVPASATAAAISLTALNGEANGYLVAFAYNSARPAAVSLSYSGAETTTASQIVPLNISNISIYSSKQAHVVGDVTGYFAPSIGATVEADGSILFKSARILTVDHPSTGSFVINVDSDVTDCATTVTGWSSAFLASGYSHGTQIVVSISKILGNPATSVPSDAYFGVRVSC